MLLYSIHDTIQWSKLNIEKSSHHISWCLFVNYWNPQYSVLKIICLRPLSPLHTRQAHYHCHSLEKSCILLHRQTVIKRTSTPSLHYHLKWLSTPPHDAGYTQPPNTTTTPEDNSTQSTFYAPYHPSSNNLFRKLPSKVILYPCTTRPQHWATSSTMDPKQYTIFARNVILEEDPKQSVLKKIAASELPSCSLTNDFLRWLLLCVSLLRNFSWIWFW